MSARIWGVLKKAVATALVVRELLNLWEWSDRHVWLDAKFSARPGKYDSAFTFYLRGPMEALSDRRVRRVSIVKGAQIGFTTMLANWIMYLVDMDPGATLLCQPSRKIVRRYVKKELHLRFTSCPRLAPYLPANRKEKFTAEEMYFTSMDFFATGVGSPSLLASLPIKNAAGDEVDKWEGEDDKEAGRLDLLTARLITFEALGTSKLVIGSTPTIPEMTISVEAAKGTCEHFYVPCPECDFMQELLFEHFDWKGTRGTVNPDGSWNLDAVEKGTRYHCQNPDCGCFIPYEKKQWMMRRGEWRSHNPQAPKDHRSFYIGGELGALSWGQLAKKFLELQYVPGGLHHFWNSYLGRAWERKTGGASKKAITQIQEASPEFELGNPQEKDAPLVLPFRPAFITMHVDVQQLEFYWTMRAWLLSPDGAHVVRALIACGQCVSFAEIIDLSNRVWTFDHGDGGPMEEFTVFSGVMDSGYRTKRGASVYNFVHEQGGRWTATKGGGFRGKETPISETTVAHKYQNAGEVQIPFMHYNDDVMKEHLYRFVIREQKFPFWLPRVLPPEYIEQITSERLTRKKQKDGRTVEAWTSDIDPHFGDCEKLGELFAFSFSREVVAKMLTLLDGKRALLMPKSHAPRR